MRRQLVLMGAVLGVVVLALAARALLGANVNGRTVCLAAAHSNPLAARPGSGGTPTLVVK